MIVGVWNGLAGQKGAFQESKGWFGASHAGSPGYWIMPSEVFSRKRPRKGEWLLSPPLARGKKAV
jgi:hypothetical protein